MAYKTTGRLPAEKASKLGHTEIVQSESVREVLENFTSNTIPTVDPQRELLQWHTAPTATAPLAELFASDGSYSGTELKGQMLRQIVFVKTALVHLRIADMNLQNPLALAALLQDSVSVNATVFPMKNIFLKQCNFEAVRRIAYDSIGQASGLMDTLRWLLFEEWRLADDAQRPRGFIQLRCPHCGRGRRFTAGQTMRACGADRCGKDIFLTDILGFPQALMRDSTPENIVTMYMLTVETLLLIDQIRRIWQTGDFTQFASLLFLKDGPLTLPTRSGTIADTSESTHVSLLTDALQQFFSYAAQRGVPLYVVGVEKSGKLVEHLSLLARQGLRAKPWSYALPSHTYVQNEVRQCPVVKSEYGARSGWGRPVLVHVDTTTNLVLNIPRVTLTATGTSQPNERARGWVQQDEHSTMARVMATLPALLSRAYENALWPICVANSAASLSVYPSGKILADYANAAMEGEVG